MGDDSEPLERLRRLLGGAELQGLRERLRARYERGEWRDEFTLTDLSAAERRTLEGLLARPVRAVNSMRVRHSELDEVIARAGLAPDLRTALELLDGPLLNLSAERALREQAWQSLIEHVTEPRLRGLVADVGSLALLKRFSLGEAARAELLLSRVQEVLKHLPAQGMPLAQLAARTLGDSHALDAGQPVATLVLRACGLGVLPDPDEKPRDQWARVGVTVGELARPVLILNLRATDLSTAARLACIAAERGDPVHLSLRVLLRESAQWDVAQRDVWVCENPSIVAIAADRLGARCAPLVCMDGFPATAQRVLLEQIVHLGGRLHYHGDFDWAGIVIGNFVMRTVGARPWRFGSRDYEAAPSERGEMLSAEGKVEATWDGDLAATMIERGRVVHEEAVVEALLMDLAGAT